MSVADLVSNTPVCPVCGEVMAKRNSAKFGAFWGCTSFPNCKGTRKYDAQVDWSKIAKTTEYEPIVKLPGSYEQEAIWEAMTKGKKHVIVNAGPGTGKSWSMIQGCLRIQRTMKVRFMAFNRHINKELTGKLSASGCRNVTPSTFHGFGFSILKKNLKSLPADPNENKMKEILESLSPEPLYGKSQWRKTLNLAEKLSRLIKNYMVDYRADDFVTVVERLADHHGLEFVNFTSYSDAGTSNQPANLQHAIELLPEALDQCIARAPVSFDFDDMLWLPIVMNLPIDQYDMVISDESQDLNVLQHQMVLRASEQGRAVIVGDRHQSIYGFRGASTESMEILTETLRSTDRGVMELPLTITRRCPKLHVMMAQNLFPEIQALEDAPIGEILTMKPDLATDAMKIGDLVICRINKQLITTAYKLIRRGVRPSIKGRDIGKGLISLLDSLVKRIGDMFVGPEPSTSTLVCELSRYRFEQESKLLPLGDKAQGRIGALHDKCDCLLEFITNSSTLTEIRSRINTLFSDDENSSTCVVLGTIHRTKGLEAERVFVLAPELIPFPMAKKPWEVAQEINCAWIAATRSKFNNTTGAPGTIIFCGNIPSIYGSKQYVSSASQVV
jgi:DNA helicase-2/ATP-dependent DNA helicase PcrA